MAKKTKSRKHLKSKIEEQVRTVLDESGMTRYRIAKLSGLPLPTMYRFCSGQRRLEFHTLEKLLGALGYELCIRQKTTPT